MATKPVAKLKMYGNKKSTGSRSPRGQATNSAKQVQKFVSNNPGKLVGSSVSSKSRGPVNPFQGGVLPLNPFNTGITKKKKP